MTKHNSPKDIDLEQQLKLAQQRIIELECLLKPSENDSQLRALIDNLPGVSYRCASDEDWTMEFISAGIEMLSGYPASDFYHNQVRSYASIIHPDDVTMVDEIIDIWVRQKQPYTIEYRIIHADGSVHWVYEKGQGLFNDAGELEWLDGVILDITDRQLTYDLLLKNKKRLKKTQEIAHLGSWELDLQTNEITWSDEAYRIFGFQLDDQPITYEIFLDTVHPDDREMVNRAYRDSIKNNANDYELEHRIIQKSTGKIRYVHEKCEHIKDKSGKIIQSIGISHDITDNKRLEITQHENEIQFQKIIDSSPLPYALNNEKQEITYINPAFIKTFGYELSDIPTLADWWPKAYPDEEYRNWVVTTWQQHFDRAKRNNTGVEPLELNIQCKDKTSRTVLLSASSLTGAFENIHLVILYDITERKLAKQKLNQTIALLENIVNSSHDLIFVKDREFRTIFCNQAYANAVGKTREAMYGNTDIENGWDPELVNGNPDKDIRGFIHDDKNALMGMDVHNPYDPANIDGEIRIFDTHKMPLIDKHKQTIGVLGVARDVTENKRTEEQLRHSQKMDALGKLTGGIAHDFNNMLSVIIGYSELLQDNISHDPKLSGYIKEIHMAGDRAKKLTSKLLGFSRKQSSDDKPCLINELLNRDRDMLEKILTAKIKLNFTLSDQAWTTFIDEELLADSILNMCINAMHAMPNGGGMNIVTNNVHLDKNDVQLLNISSGDYIQLLLTDNGSGMDQSTVDRIFEPFFTTKGDSGTGLGMSQVYGFIKQSKGDIRITSTLSQGTSIIIYFPRYAASDKHFVQHTESSIESLPEGKETILIVDDEVTLRKLAEEILSLQNYRVFAAENARQALEILDRETIDLLLSDVIMPEMDGYELARLAREKCPDIKIQLISGYNDKHFTQGADEILQQQQLAKPYQLNVLLKRIRDLLDEK